MSRGNLLLVISSLDGGGAARVITELAAEFDRFGYDVTLLTLEGEGSVDVFPIPENVRRHRIQLMWPTGNLFDKLFSAVKRLRLLRTALLNGKPDAIVSFIDTTNIRVLAATIFSNVPVIVSERTDPRHHLIGKVWNTLRRILYRRAAFVVVQTERVADWMRSEISCASRIKVIPNAVRDSTKLGRISRPLKADGRNVVSVGRLIPSKRFDLLIEAFAESGLASFGWKLTIAGTGPEESRLRARVETLFLTASVAFPGHCQDIDSFLREGDVFVLASEYEGFPNALLEAMQVGLACISSNCESGPAELITHGVNGLLVPVGDRHALILALKELAFNSAMRQGLGAAAMDVREFYNPDVIAARWIALLPFSSSSSNRVGTEQ